MNILHIYIYASPKIKHSKAIQSHGFTVCSDYTLGTKEMGLLWLGMGCDSWFPTVVKKWGTNEVSYYHMLSLLGENPDN